DDQKRILVIYFLLTDRNDKDDEVASNSLVISIGHRLVKFGELDNFPQSFSSLLLKESEMNNVFGQVKFV
ncbi:MAG: hypothetical protein ACXABM_14750, partial [Candidatus Thorarchaeota archaeon]